MPTMPCNYWKIRRPKKTKCWDISNIVITSYSIHYTKLYERQEGLIANSVVDAVDRVILAAMRQLFHWKMSW